MFVLTRDLQRCKHVNLCSLYFLLFISMLAVVNDMNSAKIKTLESCVPRFG